VGAPSATKASTRREAAGRAAGPTCTSSDASAIGRRMAMGELRVGMCDNKILAHYREEYPYISMGRARRSTALGSSSGTLVLSRGDKAVRGGRR
jgi:hypothetical protein